MAITRKDNPDEEGLFLVINNGDQAALAKATARLGFKSEESLLRYVLAVMSQSATRTLTVIDQDGKSTALNPSEALLAPAPAPVVASQPVSHAATK